MRSSRRSRRARPPYHARAAPPSGPAREAHDDTLASPTRHAGELGGRPGAGRALGGRDLAASSSTIRTSPVMPSTPPSTPFGGNRWKWAIELNTCSSDSISWVRVTPIPPRVRPGAPGSRRREYSAIRQGSFVSSTSVGELPRLGGDPGRRCVPILIEPGPIAGRLPEDEGVELTESGCTPPPVIKPVVAPVGAMTFSGTAWRRAAITTSATRLWVSVLPEDNAAG